MKKLRISFIIIIVITFIICALTVYNIKGDGLFFSDQAAKNFIKLMLIPVFLLEFNIYFSIKYFNFIDENGKKWKTALNVIMITISIINILSITNAFSSLETIITYLILFLINLILRVVYVSICIIIKLNNLIKNKHKISGS